MAASVLYVDFRWQQIDPDGSPCYCCGDAMFLWSWRMVTLINGKPAPDSFLASCGDQVVICGACYEVETGGE